MNKLIQDGLCTGCGICISESTSKQMKMAFNKYGFLVPINVQQEDLSSFRVCPFNPNPEEWVKDEDELAKQIWKSPSNIDFRIGSFENTYVGYSPVFRETSSSGGIATFVFDYLLKNKIVDYLFIVIKKEGKYQYQLFNNIDCIKDISKTRYYPVTMESLFEEIDRIDGKIAVSGVGCFIKAIRLKQMYHPKYKEKITFLVGLICGGVKSYFFADYLAASAGAKGTYHSPEFRLKDLKSKANDYSFSCVSENNKKLNLKMRSVGDMWGTGYFKSNACDFCTDVTTELADISVGDAWLKEYLDDGAGNSVIITRSKLADDIIATAIIDNELNVRVVDKEIVIRSQLGSFTHRQDAIKFRAFIAKTSITPYFRRKYKTVISPFQMGVQIGRRLTRSRSLDIWYKFTNVKKFNSKMKKYKIFLKIMTKLDHICRGYGKNK